MPEGKQKLRQNNTIGFTPRDAGYFCWRNFERVSVTMMWKQDGNCENNTDTKGTSE